MTDPVHVLNFLLYFAVAVLLLIAFLTAFTLVTSIAEWQRIRDGNSAVAIALGGAMLGFTMPLVSAITHNNTLPQTIVTAAVALAVQLLCHLVLRLIRPGSDAAIDRGEMSEAILRAATALSLGLLNAACLT